MKPFLYIFNTITQVQFPANKTAHMFLPIAKCAVPKLPFVVLLLTQGGQS